MICDLYIEDVLLHTTNCSCGGYVGTDAHKSEVYKLRTDPWSLWYWQHGWEGTPIRSTCDFEAMDKLQNLCDIATDMHAVILGLCYLKFTEINACFEAGRQSGLYCGREIWMIDDVTFRRDVLGRFSWYARANLKLGSLTLTPDTGALVVYKKTSHEDSAT